MPEGKDLPPDSELAGKCQTIGRREVIVEPAMVGAPKGIQLVAAKRRML